MSKKDFIALADMIIRNNRMADSGEIDYDLGRVPERFNFSHIIALADHCKANNRNFMRDRWLDYIAGKCGKNGGAVKAA